MVVVWCVVVDVCRERRTGYGRSVQGPVEMLNSVLEHAHELDLSITLVVGLDSPVLLGADLGLLVLSEIATAIATDDVVILRQGRLGVVCAGWSLHDTARHVVEGSWVVLIVTRAGGSFGLLNFQRSTQQRTAVARCHGLRILSRESGASSIVCLVASSLGSTESIVFVDLRIQVVECWHVLYLLIN